MSLEAGMRIWVTGATGFVGRRLVARLRAEGAEVFASDRELDVTDADALGTAIWRERPAAVVHLAAQSSVAAARGDPAGTYRVNFEGTHCLLSEIARRAPDARILLVASGDVYGSAPPGSAPFDESAPLQPRSAYGRSKAAADLLGGIWARRGLSVLRLRPFNHTGPGQSEAFVASSFARQVAEIAAGNRPARLRVGNLDSVRDFLDVDDVIEAYVRLLAPQVPAQIYNVASGTGISAREILERLMRIAGVRPEVEVDPARFRPTDYAVGNAARLSSLTGWAPAVPLDDTLTRLVDYWRDQTEQTGRTDRPTAR